MGGFFSSLVDVILIFIVFRTIYVRIVVVIQTVDFLVSKKNKSFESRCYIIWQKTVVMTS